MVRAFFVAIGLTLLLLGGEAVVLDHAVLNDRFAEQVVPAYDPLVDIGPPPSPEKKPRVITPPEWAPWSLLSASAVVLLYAATLRRG
ncbi:MAG: hypothetical protein KDB27_17075 [Planctomycetales bacterium]|nr:hypothetical protein [Planctomycetales bacterium]